MRMATKKETRVPNYKSCLSEFDEFVSSDKTGSGGVSRALSDDGFEMGDMVWGKVKSHPWWPGQIFNEAFASPSVRRLRKTGYFLVAFFGDSSYGWFDPSELIPFEPHLAEKSKQTKSIHFVKAVEEAMDEICRRSALGLTCKCRNPRNFRPANVSGYFAVELIDDYKIEAVYSSKQIKKARYSFQSSQTLSFLKRCALAPLECGNTDSVKFLQKKAVVSAFRRAVFEEFDDTYQLAFGARTAYALVKSQEQPSRGPLSGPMVTAETPRDAKSSENTVKVKESTKQDKYLLPKRREEAGVMGQFSQVKASSQLQETDRYSAGDHVVQRNAPYHQTPFKPKQTFTSSSGDIPRKESPVSKLSRDDGKGLAKESKPRMRVNTPLVTNYKKFGVMTSLGQKTDTRFRSNKVDSIHPFIEEKSSVGIKKVNVLRRVSSEMDSESRHSELKKKKKNESGPELNCDNQERRKALSYGAKKSSQLGSVQRHSNMLLTAKNSEFTLVQQMLSNLKALSLDPFSGSSDTSSFRAVKLFFLRFRSLSGPKKLAISHSSDATQNARHTTKPSKSANIVNRADEPSRVKRLWSDHQQDVPSTKKLKVTNNEAKDRSNLAPAKAQPEKKIDLSASPCKVDISEEMMKLLFRCNDVVVNIKGLLGYVPNYSL